MIKLQSLVMLALLSVPSVATVTHEVSAAQKNVVKFKVRVDPDRGGKVHCALYNDEDTWLTDDVYKSRRVEVDGRYATCVFKNLPKRKTYAIAALHDEDGDGEMDTNLIGLPEEGYAASRDAHREGIGAPDWDDAVFKYRGGVSRQRASMKY